MYVDGALNAQGGGDGIILVGPKDIELAYALHFDFKVTNTKLSIKLD